MAELRKRAAAGPSADGSNSPSDADSLSRKIKAEDAGGSSISATDVLRMLVGITLLSSALSYFVTGGSFTWGYTPWWTKTNQLKAWKVQLCPDSIWTRPSRIAMMGLTYS